MTNHTTQPHTEQAPPLQANADAGRNMPVDGHSAGPLARHGLFDIPRQRQRRIEDWFPN